MKIEVTRDNFRRGLEAVSGAVPTRNVLPVLQMVKMEAADGRLRLETSNLDTHLTFAVDCEVSEPGSICLPAKRLLDIAKVAADAPVKLDADETKAKIKAGRTSYSVNGLEAAEFPDPPNTPFGDDHILTARELWRLLDQVGFCASTEETRPILNGVLWEITEGAMSMVATNGHRMARYSVPVAVLAGAGGEPEEPRSEIIHPKSVQLGRALFEDDAEVEVAFSDRYVALRSGDSKLLARLVEGPYPNYDQVIPRDNDKEVRVHRDSLVTAVKRVAIVSATTPTRRIRFSLTPNEIALSAQSADEGNAADTVACEYDGPPFEIGFDSRYLLEMLPVMPTETIRLTLKAPERPMMVLPVGEDAPELINLIMPLRLND